MCAGSRPPHAPAGQRPGIEPEQWSETVPAGATVRDLMRRIERRTGIPWDCQCLAGPMNGTRASVFDTSSVPGYALPPGYTGPQWCRSRAAVDPLRPTDIIAQRGLAGGS